MKRIIAVHHADGSSEYVCPKCCNKTAYVHSTGHSDDIMDHYTCKECGYSENEDELWQRHKAQVFANIKNDKSEAMFQ